MKFEGLELWGIKSFDSLIKIPLSSDDEGSSLVTISGPNGSGKSAIVESLAALQAAFLMEGLRAEFEHERSFIELEDGLNRRLGNLASDKESTITLRLSNDLSDGAISLTIYQSRAGILYETKQVGKAADELVADWRSATPRNLILAIPSTKHFNQDDVLFTRLRDHSIVQDAFDEYLIEWSLRPLILDLASGMRESYRQLLEDWFYERISPGRKRNVYQKIANVYLNILFPDVHISNFSATSRSGEITCLAKRDDVNSSLYDIRNLSSGEKYVYLLFSHLAHFIGQIGLVVFDEPENHLHENTLVEFVDLLRKGLDPTVTNAERLQEFAEASSAVKRFTEAELKALNLLGTGPLFKAVLLVTHSKLIVRRNIFSGRNILLRSGGISELHQGDVESKLRVAGVSQVDERVIFVEGDTDIEVIRQYFRGQNVELRSLNGKDAVCSAFEGFAALDVNDRHPGYAFLLDRDSPNEYKLKKARDRNPEKWDKHVLVLERTELENFLLEPSVFHAALLSILDEEEVAAKKSIVSFESIEQQLRSSADASIALQRGNFLRREMERAIEREFHLPRPTEIKFEAKDFETQIRRIVCEASQVRFIKAMTNARSLCDEIYSNDNWAIDWRALCKGKKALQSSCHSIVKQLGIKGLSSQFLRSRIIRRAAENSDIELRRILELLHAIIYRR